MFKIKLSERAEQESESIFNHYNVVSARVSKEFVNILYEHLGIISENPKIYQKLKNNFRACPLRKFPYSIIYSVENNFVLVASVFHHKRNPKNLLN